MPMELLKEFGIENGVNKVGLTSYGIFQNCLRS